MEEAFDVMCAILGIWLVGMTLYLCIGITIMAIKEIRRDLREWWR